MNKEFRIQNPRKIVLKRSMPNIFNLWVTLITIEFLKLLTKTLLVNIRYYLFTRCNTFVSFFNHMRSLLISEHSLIFCVEDMLLLLIIMIRNTHSNFIIIHYQNLGPCLPTNMRCSVLEFDQIVMFEDNQSRNIYTFKHVILLIMKDSIKYKSWQRDVRRGTVAERDRRTSFSINPFGHHVGRNA